MDTIALTGLVFEGKHGVNESEQKTAQRLRVDITITANLQTAIRTDNLAETVDYAKVRKAVRELVEGQSFKLLETLADKIAQKVLSFRRATCVTVTITKLDIWETGAPSVTVCREV